MCNLILAISVLAMSTWIKNGKTSKSNGRFVKTKRRDVVEYIKSGKNTEIISKKGKNRAPLVIHQKYLLSNIIFYKILNSSHGQTQVSQMWQQLCCKDIIWLHNSLQGTRRWENYYGWLHGITISR